MIHRARSLVTVLALALPGVASADPTSTFLKQDKYTYCDVKALSAIWKQSISDAKVTVGVKLEAKNTAYLDAELKNARQFTQKNPQLRCNYVEAGFTYDDAKKLAAIWKVDVSKAKAMIETKIASGGEQSLRVMVKGSNPTQNIAASDPTSVFLAQDRYGGCEVKLLAKLWKTTAADAKARIGAKLAAKSDRALATELQAARQAGLKCTAADAGFTAAEVKHMMKIWEMSAADIDNKITNGSTKTLRGMLADNPAPTGDMAVFANQTKYTYCDAHMLGTLWSKSASDGKAFIGAKLAAKKKGAIDKAVAEARKNAVKNEAARCPYYGAGIGYEDMMLLAPLWKKPEDQMKAEVGLRIAKGQETAIKAQIAKAKKAAAKKPPANTRPLPKQPAPVSDKPGFDKQPAPPAQEPKTKPLTK